MQPTAQSIADETESAISFSSSQKAHETARRATDFFASSASLFKDDQIELFSAVLERLIQALELRALADMGFRIALAEMSTQLAPLSLAPKSVICRLGENNDIATAEAVLGESARLGSDLGAKSTLYLPHFDCLAVSCLAVSPKEPEKLWP